ncbi:unnamed protein product [Cochlearia groenlandica]
MGRVKLQIKKLDNINGRQATYAKRKHGILKKAKELSILCDIGVVLLMFSPTGKPSICIGKHSVGEVIAKLAQVTPQERAKKRLENLEALKKTFMKLDHDVNIAEFLDRSKPTIEGLSEKVRFLQNHLAELQTRLSYWTEIEKIESEDDLQQLENSLRQSLYQIRSHKDNMLQHQQQLMSSQCKNQNVIDLDFGMDMEQHLENFSWIRTDETVNHPIQVEDPNQQIHHTYEDITCSASLPLASYSELFGKSSAINLETGVKPYDPNHQYTNLSFLNDPKLQQLAEWNIFGSPADFYVSQILEATSRPQYEENLASSEAISTYPDVHHSRQPK